MSDTVCKRLRNLSSVHWVCVVGIRGGFLCGMEHGMGKARLMRVVACTAELRLMGVIVILKWMCVCLVSLVTSLTTNPDKTLDLRTIQFRRQQQQNQEYSWLSTLYR